MRQKRTDPLLERIRKDIAEGNSNTPLSDLDVALHENHKIDRSAPIAPVHVEPDYERLVFINGRWMHDVKAVFKQSDIERIRQGYGCLQCWRTFTEAFPDRCPQCGYLVGRYQSEDFGKQFKGDTWLGSQVDPAEESQIMQDHLERWKLEQGLRSRGIWVP